MGQTKKTNKKNPRFQFQLTRGVHGQAVDGVPVPVEAGGRHRVVGGRQGRQRVHVPQENGLVEAGRGDLEGNEFLLIVKLSKFIESDLGGTQRN